MASAPKSRAKTTETSISIVETLRERDGATIEELSEILGLAESTVHRHLVTLREHRFVVKHGETYRVGLQFLTLGGYAQRQVTAFPIVKEKVDELADQTGERAHFIVEEAGERVYVYTETGPRTVHTGAYTGKRGELHTSAAGKAILAEMPQSRVLEIIEARGLEEETAQSIVQREALFEELEEVRERGYALSMEEAARGVHGVGAAIREPDGTPIGGLVISGPANRLREGELHEDLAELLLAQVNELELHIEHAVLG